MLTPQLVELRQLVGLHGQAAPLAAPRHEPVVGGLRIVERLRLAASVVGGRPTADAEEGERRAWAHAPVALEDFLRRKLVGQRRVIEEAQDEADDRTAEQ